MKRCLVVDDSLVTRLMLKEILQQLEPGTQVIQANCGDDALSKTDQAGFIDYALIDFNMPGMNGLQLAEQLRSTGKMGKMALLTANIQESVKQQAESKGLKFLNKPLNEETISTFVKNGIDSSHPNA